MSAFGKENQEKKTAENEMESRPPVPVKLQPIPAGCSRCKTKPPRGPQPPSWFYRSRSGTRLPALTLRDIENDKRFSTSVSEDQRLSRVQEWLRRSVKGGSTGELEKIGEDAELKRKTNREIMEDARKWYQKKMTRTSETIFSDPSEGFRPQLKTQSKQKDLFLNNHKHMQLEPLIDQKSQDSNSVVTSSVLKKYKDMLEHKAGVLPSDSSLKQYYERKHMLENYKANRTFTEGLHTKDQNLCRTAVGPIARPHTPVRSLAERQRSYIGDGAWFDGARKKQQISDVRKMQSRTYELQSQLQQMLDRQQRG